MKRLCDIPSLFSKSLVTCYIARHGIRHGIRSVAFTLLLPIQVALMGGFILITMDVLQFRCLLFTLLAYPHA